MSSAPALTGSLRSSSLSDRLANLSGRATPLVGTGNSSYSSNETSAVEHIKQEKSETEVKAQPDEPMITIHIGRSRVPFQVPYSSLSDRLHLLELKVWYPKQGWTISRPLFDTINPEHFRPVTEYLSRGDYAPDLVGRDTDAAHLDGIKTEQQKAAELVRCGMVFNIAREVQLSDLIELVVRKMKLLRPWPLLELIMVLQWVLVDASTGFEADDELRNMLEEHVAHNFWDLVQLQTSNLSMILNEHLDFQAAVMARVAEKAKAKAKCSAG